MNRKQLLAALRAAGYSGDATLDAIKQWVSAENIDIVSGGKSVDLDKAWNTKAVIITPTAGEEIEIREPEDASDAEIEGNADDMEDEEDMAKSAKPAVRKSVQRPSLKVDADAFSRKSPERFHIPNPDARLYEKKVKTGKAAFGSADEAEQFGAWFRAGVLGKGTARDKDICRKSQVTFENSRGGALVPEQFEASLILLQEQFGVAPQIARTIDVTSGQPIIIPRLTSGLSVYGPEEGGTSAITASDSSFDNVELTYKDRYTLTRISRRLMDASALDIADITAQQIAQAFAYDMDNAYFNGDGTSTYFGITGVREALKGLDNTIANIAGLQVASGNLFSEFTLDDFDNMMGLLPVYPTVTQPRLVMHSKVWHGVLKNLINAAGGSTKLELTNGTTFGYEGVEVQLAQVMPKADANSQVAVLYGYFDMGSIVSRVRGGMEIAVDESRYFDTDQVAIRGKHTLAINVHDVGNASAVAASREAGPIVGLISAAS